MNDKKNRDPLQLILKGIFIFLCFLILGCEQSEEESLLSSDLKDKPLGASKIVGSYNFCNYKMYPKPIALDSNSLKSINGPVRKGQYTFQMNIMAPSALTFGEALKEQGLPDTRYMAEMYVNIGNMFLDKSVDLILESIEPTLWRIRGDHHAIRKIIVRSPYCSAVVVTGVSPSNIVIDTAEFKHSKLTNVSTYKEIFVQSEVYGESIGRVFKVSF